MGFPVLPPQPIRRGHVIIVPQNTQRRKDWKHARQAAEDARRRGAPADEQAALDQAEAVALDAWQQEHTALVLQAWSVVVANNDPALRGVRSELHMPAPEPAPEPAPVLMTA